MACCYVRKSFCTFTIKEVVKCGQRSISVDEDSNCIQIKTRLDLTEPINVPPFGWEKPQHNNGYKEQATFTMIHQLLAIYLNAQEFMKLTGHPIFQILTRPNILEMHQRDLLSHKFLHFVRLLDQNLVVLFPKMVVPSENHNDM